MTLLGCGGDGGRDLVDGGDDMAPEITATKGTGVNDLDLYAFADRAAGLIWAGASTREPGNPEVIMGTVPAGTYCFGVQAWDTPSGPVPYWVSIR